MDLAYNCPQYWYGVTRETPAGPGWLNGTIVNAECFAGIHTDVSPSKVEDASVTSSVLPPSGTASSKPSAAVSAPSSAATSSGTTKGAFDGGKELLLPAFVNVVGLALLL